MIKENSIATKVILKKQMNIIIVLVIVLITLLSRIDNKLLENSTIKLPSLYRHKEKIIEILTINQQKNNKLQNSIHNKIIRKRSSPCATACQPHDCCLKAQCLCIRDYWGPICYCRK